MGWSYRTGTNAAQKVPNDWDSLCLGLALQTAHSIHTFNIPPQLVINADQTGVVVIPTGTKTWAPIGDKQVSIIAKEEKQQYTLML